MQAIAPHTRICTYDRPGTGESERVPQRFISEVIEPRLEEIFTMVRNDLRRAGVYHSINGGVVVSGGGSQLAETPRLASRILDGLPVRVGAPRNLAGLADSVSTPMHATAVGLALQAREDGADATEAARLDALSLSGIMRRLREWWEDFLPHVSRPGPRIPRP